MRINIYIKNTDCGTEPRVCTEKDKLKVILQMAQKFRKDATWINNTLFSHYRYNELYEKMLTEKGRKEVEDIIREQAKSEADDWLNDWHYDDEREWFEVEVTE